MPIEIPLWPYVYGSPSGSGKLRSAPEDFKVYENLSFEPSGDGEHAFLQIEKTGQNTEFVARQLARVTAVRQRDIGYAGLKDRHAVTTQWFSVWLPGRADPDWSILEKDGINILQVTRHARKLKRGALSGNRFEITIRDWQGDKEQLIKQLTAIKTNGLANYYGEQRFGYNGKNVANALAMFQGQKVKREQRSLYLSAARSYLFNLILSQRVVNGTWDKAIVGDTFMLDGSHSCFQSQQPDDDILRRINAKAIHPTGVLWGKGNIDIALDALQIEQDIINANAELAQGLIASGADKSRRAFRVNADDLDWSFLNHEQIWLTFTLPAGSYATALLREIVGGGLS